MIDGMEMAHDFSSPIPPQLSHFPTILGSHLLERAQICCVASCFSGKNHEYHSMRLGVAASQQNA